MTTTDDPATDWYAWHAPYDELVSPLSRRLAVVQDAVRGVLDDARPGPLRVVSLASGQARDLLPLLIEHPRGVDVQALLVEQDARNADFAEGAVLGAALHGVRVVVGDAGDGDVLADAVPADLVLACGLFGLLDDDEAEAVVRALPHLLAAGGRVVWTRNRRHGDPTRRLRDAFAAAGMSEVSYTAGAPEEGSFSVGVARWDGPDGRLAAGTRVFGLS
ncbi:class I SAM-dependent methyltransferase [Klenkia brasiliensis]|uniref:Methyltransferase domain-containing protein n=1 Tax=Klenkia brasiliensis TaxID=333142 RepID=A0A1G7SV87_9ACTN|nr:class I SAM-dependent methyltransferase [Klenkia brasiliensis]SDG26997.1 hypothetical protein SAMN05660324_2185 [Klenkia brasiliensis]